MATNRQAIPIYPGTPQGQTDPRTHFWYQTPKGHMCRLCDDAVWPPNVLPSPSHVDDDVPCIPCRDLYVADITLWNQFLDPQMPLDSYTFPVVHSLKIGGYPNQQEMTPLEIHTMPLTAFARFFEATPAAKVRMVRDARLFQSDPDGYRMRAYYGEFRNALKRTHWQGTDLDTFEASLEEKIANLAKSARRGHDAKEEHYRDLGEAYRSFWSQYPDATMFEVPPAETEIAGLKIRITAEFGVCFGGDDYVLEPYFRAPKPTRLFRQAVQYITEQARPGIWNPNWHARIYDARRKIILPEERVRPQDLRHGLRGAAADFQETWRSLE